MKGLLDTHTFIWWDSDPLKLSAAARAFIGDPSNEVMLSVVSVWEIIIKSQLGKVTLRLPLRDILVQQQANGIQILGPTVDHVLAVESLPPVHKDPFDWLLIGQATVEGALLLSVFALVASGAVRLWMVWALALVYGFINVVDNPSRQSFAVEMVGPDDLINAVGLNSVIVNSSRIVGPAVAGLLIAVTHGTQWAFLANAVSFAAVIGAPTPCGRQSCTAGRRSAAPRARSGPGCATPGTTGSCACRCS